MVGGGEDDVLARFVLSPRQGSGRLLNPDAHFIISYPATRRSRGRVISSQVGIVLATTASRLICDLLSRTQSWD